MVFNIARLCSVRVCVFCPVIYLYLAGNTRDTVNTQPENWEQIKNLDAIICLVLVNPFLVLHESLLRHTGRRLDIILT